MGEEFGIGSLAVAAGKVTPDELDRALEAQRASSTPLPLGEILIRQGSLTTADCAELLLAQERRLGRAVLPRVGNFLLLHELGRGGLGVVWRAWDPKLGRGVAIKRLKADEEGERQILLREARLAGQLSHPNIVPVYEVFEHEGSPCVVMGLVEGWTWDRVPDLTLRRLLELLRDAARAVGHAHSKGIVHRDLKPQNLMVGRDGKVVVMDFGLAKATRADASKSAGGAVAGTPAFMAPEQALGKRERIGPATDVYGLGATMYALLAGRPPFEGAIPAVVMMHVVNDEPAPLRSVRPGLHRDVETIVRQAMHKDPNRRYPTAEAFAEDLRRFLAGEEILAKPSGSMSRAARRVRRSGALVLAGVLAVAAAIWGVSAWRTASSRRQARAHLEEARGALQEADRFLYRDSPNLAAMRERIETAARAVERALAAAPDLPEAHFVRASIRQFRGEAEEADRDFTRALDLDPAFAVCRIRRALHRLAQRMVQFELLSQQFPDATASFQAEEISRELEAGLDAGLPVSDSDVAYARIAVQTCRGRFQEAAQRSDEALRRSESVEILRVYSFVLARLGRKKESREALERAIRLKPYDPYARLAVVRLLELPREREEAFRHLDAAQAILPRRAEVLRVRGGIHLDLEEREEAIRSFTRAIEIDPGDGDAYCGRGFALRLSERLEDALADYTRGIDLLRVSGPLEREGNARVNRGYLLRRADRLEEALIDDTRAVEIWNHLGWPRMEGSARINRAVTLTQLRRYEEALADLAAAEAMDLREPRVSTNRARVFHARGETDRAIAELTRAVERGVESAYVWELLGQYRYMRGDPAGAVEAYSKSLALDSKQGRLYGSRAQALVDLKRWGEAKKDLDVALTHLPKNVELLVMRARCAYFLSDDAGALADAGEALAADPTCSDASYVRCMVEVSRSEWDKAESDADRAARGYLQVDHREKLSLALMWRGYARGRLGREREGFEDLAESSRLVPANGMPHYYRGVLLQEKNPQGAREAFRRAAELTPSNQDAWFRLGSLAYQAGDFAEAERAAARAAAMKSDHAESWKILGVARHRQHNHEGAIEAFTRAAELRPRSADILANRALARLSADRIEEAEQDARLAVEAEPGSAFAHEMLGRVRAKAGDRPGALGSLRRALELDPKGAVCRGYLGTLLAEEGKDREAIEELERAVREMPALRESLQATIDQVRRRLRP